MTFLTEAVDGIVPARIVRLERSRSEDFVEVDELVWSTRRVEERARLGVEALDFSWAVGVDVPTEGGARLGAVASALSFDLPVPGGRVNAAGLTCVGVRPEYRGRGFLRAMIARHFADCRDREVPVSLLFASEMSIYGRFGYGLGSTGVTLRLPRGAALRPLPQGGAKVEARFETGSFEAHGAVIEAIDRQLGHGPSARPGWTGLTSPARQRLLFQDEGHKDLALEPWRVLIVSRDGEPTGYALVRRESKWDGDLPAGTATVRVAQALDPASGHELWRQLLSLPLVAVIETPPLPLDHPLLHWLEDWRAGRPAWGDFEHVRLVDVPAALRARRYAAPLDLRLAVRDRLLGHNEGVWRLRGGLDGAEVAKVAELTDDADADLALDVRELGSLYLGGVTATSLAGAGLVAEATAGAVGLAARAFAAERAPGTPHPF
ncbi:MAG: GNAT family N-acetyltransferase [Bifidobacteriaceae bacterium]|nr:GNAT family N-acetyltransferase [Bifidobacteriaceae bacterium]